MSENNHMVGMLMLGLSIGSFIPRSLPAPANVLDPYMSFTGFLFLAIAILLFVKG
ncbi:MAG: hypothetical protein NTW59_02395 [Candidatus Diapherotrites archaeon]|nr:hypothetical protein [Candidatus Diapherotrites archaeon]